MMDVSERRARLHGRLSAISYPQRGGTRTSIFVGVRESAEGGLAPAGETHAREDSRTSMSQRTGNELPAYFRLSLRDSLLRGPSEALRLNGMCPTASEDAGRYSR